MANPYMGVPSMYGGYEPYNASAPYSYAYPYRTPYSPPYNAPVQNPAPQAIGQPTTTQPPMQGQILQCIQVPNADYAKSVVLNPNQTLYMVSQNSPELYAKAADSMGVATMKYFKLVEFDPTMEAAQQAINTKIGNVVSREEFNAFANSVQTQFNALQNGFQNQCNMNFPQSSINSTPMKNLMDPVQQEVVVSKNEITTTKKKETTSK